jgi:hypothetical protein
MNRFVHILEDNAPERTVSPSETVWAVLWMWVVMCALFASAASASEPTRCDAIFFGPVEHCALQGTWSATGTGKTEAEASANARLRLRGAVDAAAGARALHVQGTLAEMFAERDVGACGSVVAAAARVSCMAEPALQAKTQCFATLADGGCWQGSLIETSGRAFLAMETARDQLCHEVDKNLKERRVDDETRMGCQALCQQDNKTWCAAS